MISQIIAFSLLNRAAGSEFLGFIPSSLLSRIAATFLMSLAVWDIWAFPLLMIWRTFAGSKNAGSALHGWPTEGWLAGKLSFIPDGRIRGCILMGINYLTLIPLAFYGGGMWFLIPIVPFIYYATGSAIKDDRALGIVELVTGGIAYAVYGL